MRLLSRRRLPRGSGDVIASGSSLVQFESRITVIELIISRRVPSDRFWLPAIEADVVGGTAYGRLQRAWLRWKSVVVIRHRILIGLVEL